MLVEQAMRPLRVVLLTTLVAGCHFDKLLNDSGGGAASRGGAGPPVATHLIFVTQPSDAAAGATISPPVRVAAVDDQDRVVTTFSGTISMALGHDGSLLGAQLHGTKDLHSPLDNTESAPFSVGGP